MDAGWMIWRRRPETFRIVMEPSQSGLSLPHIVATSRVDVQRGVAHAAMWRQTRHPCTMRGYDYCGLQGETRREDDARDGRPGWGAPHAGGLCDAPRRAERGGPAGAGEAPGGGRGGGGPLCEGARTA